MTLREYFRRVFSPQRLVGKHPVYCNQYLSAITTLEAFKGDDALRLDAVTDADLDAMKERCIAEGYSAITVTKYRWLLRMILHHARPDAFPPTSGRHKRPPRDIPVFDEPGTLWSFYLHTYEPHRLIGRTDGGKEQIRIAIRRLCTFAGNGRLRVLDLTDDLLMDFAHAMHAEGLAAETINTRLSKLRALWRYAVRRKLRLDLPDNERLPKMKRLPVAWSMDQMGELLKACEAEGTISGITAALFWRAFLLLLYDSGIRVRAALLLPWDCVTGRWLTVSAELMKNRTEQRFYLHSDTVAAIDAIRQPERERLFPWPWHKRTLYKRFRRMLRRAGLPDGRRDLFHKVRRTSATHLAAAVGLEHACRHLGHSGLAVTMGYIDPTMMPSIRAGEVLPRPVMPGKAVADAQ